MLGISPLVEQAATNRLVKIWCNARLRSCIGSKLVLQVTIYQSVGELKLVRTYLMQTRLS
jgi:hypothetical protein